MKILTRWFFALGQLPSEKISAQRQMSNVHKEPAKAHFLSALWVLHIKSFLDATKSDSE